MSGSHRKTRLDRGQFLNAHIISILFFLGGKRSRLFPVVNRMLKKAAFSPTQPRRAKTRCSTGKAAASKEARRTIRYVESLREARTKLADFFSILLGGSRGG
jgi:hypothetical protein